MSSEEKGKSRGLYWVFGALALVPILYVLSAGPISAICLQAGISPEALEGIYAPVIWLCEHTPLEGPLKRYLRLWNW
jgi:hypothetical protein